MAFAYKDAIGLGHPQIPLNTAFAGEYFSMV
jgi:hypothetical protein